MPLAADETRDLIEQYINSNALMAFQNDRMRIILISLQDQLDTAIIGAGGEPTIAAGTTGQYWRGDKTWQTLNATAVGLSSVPNINATNAANLASGFILAARYGNLTIPIGAINATGTPSASTALLGNGTWGTVTGTIADGDKIALTVTGDNWQINPNVVELGDLVQIATQRILGRITAATGDVEELTPAQLTTLVNQFTQTLKGAVPAPGTIDTTKFLRTDGSWAAPAGGGGAADDIQTHTTGATVTVTNGKNILVVDPGSILAALEITLPATAHASNEIQIFFGGTITTGEVITAITITPNTGQTILQATTPTLVEAGEFISYKKIGTVWYRK